MLILCESIDLIELRSVFVVYKAVCKMQRLVNVTHKAVLL